MSEEECNHAVGTAEVEYHRSILHVVEEFWATPGEYSFCAFRFCPYCGKNVCDEALNVAAEITAHWEEFWKGYGEQRGEEELKRARSSRR